MKNKQFEFIDFKDYSYKWKQEKCNISPQTVRMMRGHIISLSKSLPLNIESSIFVRVNINDMSQIKFIITGPKDTAYDSGVLQFDMKLGDTYPNAPPKVLMINTGGVRFNPNLYNNGKVCLSLLGTWKGQSGESWIPGNSTLLQVLVSIQSLILIEKPYFNEPGYEKAMETPQGIERNKNYNDERRYWTLKYLINNELKNPSRGFETIIQKHFEMKKEYILENILKWKDESELIKKSDWNIEILRFKSFMKL